MPGSLITTAIAKEVKLISSGGSYASPLTVTSTGRITAPAPDTSFQTAAAIYVNLNGIGSIDNLGIISGAIPSTSSYIAPAIYAATALDLSNSGTITGQSGVYLQNGGTIMNSGRIAGLDTQATDGYGVRLVNAELVNSGIVYGKNDGVANLDAGEVINHGTITGARAGIKLIPAYSAAYGTLVNTGSIGGAEGVSETGATITNSGTITGQTYGIRSLWGGTISNSGEISAAVDGVLLLNEKYLTEFATSFTNSGTVRGGYFGIALNAASVTNTATGLISGTDFGAGIGDLGSLTNSGIITAGYGGLVVESGGGASNGGAIRGATLGVELFSDSSMTNAASGSIYSNNTAALDQAAYFVNAGSVVADFYGAELLSGGILLNVGTVFSARTGVYLSTQHSTASPDFLGNTGYIYGRQFGVELKNGTVYNYGVIRAAQTAVSQISVTSFINWGEVYGTVYGVQLAGGTLTNAGSIGGGFEAIRLTGGGITDAGTISGLKYAVYGAGFSLTVDPGAVFKGDVVDKGKTSVLDLAGSAPGTLTGLGTQFNAFDAISFEAGAHWLISGTTAALAAQQVITGFEQGDTIIVTGFSATSDSFVSGTGLELLNGSSVETVDLAGSFTTANFNVSSNGTISTIKLKASAPCFAAGTRILTPEGEIPVQALAAGDMVITRLGEDREIIWIGHRTIDLRLHPRPGEVQPVCITAGALAEDVPQRDLWVSPDHALWIDGRLVPAQLLVNGLNIRQGTLQRVTYYHLELDQHAVIFAENAPAETYLDTGNRNAFENAGGITMLHPDFSALIRREKSCAELLLAGPQLNEIRQRCRRRHAPALTHRRK